MITDQLTEADLLNLYLETKAPDLLTVLFDKFNSRLVANATKYLRNAEAAEDCVSEAWLSLMVIDPPATQVNSAFDYLNTQVRWKIMDLCRDRKFERENFVSLEAMLAKRDEDGEPTFDIEEPEDDLTDEFAILWEKAEQGLAKLSERQREAVMLHYGKGLDRVEVGKRMGVSKWTARNLAELGMTKLRQMLTIQNSPVEVCRNSEPKPESNFSLSA